MIDPKSSFFYIRRATRRLFLLSALVCQSIADAFGNYEWQIEQEKRNKKLADIGELPQDATQTMPEWFSRKGAWDDQARFGPPNA
tara:strand:- start:1092 stop:1346 length:255 start_codon:yes stop_codon:yes gene_type:complete